MRADIHDDGADYADERSSGEAHEGSRGECFQNIFEQALNTCSEHFFFPLFRMIALDDADATERFGQAPCDFGVYFGTRAEDRSDRGKGLTATEAKTDKYAEGYQRHERAGCQKNHRGENSCHQYTQ